MYMEQTFGGECKTRISKLVYSMAINLKKIISFLYDDSNKELVIQRNMEEAEKMRQLETDLERVQNWIGNCDQKASILLATIGILFGIFFSTDAVFNKIVKALNELRLLWNSCECLQIFVYSVSLLIFFATLVLIGLSIFFLLKTIKSTINASDFKDAVCNNNHKTFFGSISAIPYNTFLEKRCHATNSERIEELISQLYINSKICNSKFEKYNTGLNLFLWGGLLICVDIIILVLI